MKWVQNDTLIHQLHHTLSDCGKLIGLSKLIFDELQAVLTQIEAILSLLNVLKLVMNFQVWTYNCDVHVSFD